MKTKNRLTILLSVLLLTGCNGHNPDVSSVIPSDTSAPVSETTSSSDSVAGNSSIAHDSVSSTVSNTTNSSVAPTPIDSRWNVDTTTYGNTFRAALQKLIKASGSKTISYTSNNEVLALSDKAQNGQSGIVPFYRPDTEATTNWNKEHVWPNSRGAGKTGLGADPQMLRPTNNDDNSSRGNYFYGDKALDLAGNTWDPASFGYEPARGEAARIVFYCATKYYQTCGTGGTSNGSAPVELSNNPADNKDLHTMGRLDRLIEWNNKYPVTEQEKRRNDYLAGAGFSRNPFIDTPDLANYIWDKNGIRTSAYQGTITPSEPTKANTYTLINDLTDLHDGDKVSIISDYDGGTEYAAMMDTPKSDTLPWYFLSQSVPTPTNGSIETMADLVQFTVGVSGSNYTFKTEKGYLYNYIDGTHYSIGMGASPINNGSNNWTIEKKADGFFNVKGERDVYLSYTSKASFAGYNQIPNIHLGFYKKA